MKQRVYNIKTVVLCALMMMSATFVCAQKWKYKPLKGAKPVTVPHVVNPKWSRAMQESITRASGVQVIRTHTAKETARAAATASVKPSQVIAQTAPKPAALPVTEVVSEALPAVQDTGTNLTGMQVLATYFPTWRQELGGMFSQEQLDAVEKAFEDTDEWIFVRDENGELQARNQDEWNYEERFLTILKESGVDFTEKQIKQLIGGRGSRGFTFNCYFTLQNERGFILTHDGDAPRTRIRENGKQLTLDELRKRAKAGDTQAAQWAEEVELGLAIHNLIQTAKKANSNNPVVEQIKDLNNANRNYAEKKSPAQIFALLQQWLKDHDSAPRTRIRENGKQLTLDELRKRAKAGDTQAAQWAEEVELGQAIKTVIKTAEKANSNNPVVEQIKDLYNANRNYAEQKSPAQILSLLQQHLKDHDSAPRAKIRENGKQLTLDELRKRAKAGDTQAAQWAEEVELGLAIQHVIQTAKKGNSNNPVVEQIKDWYNANRNHAERKSPKELYDALVQHIKDYGHYPTTREDSSLRIAVYKRLRRYQSTMVEGKYTDPDLQKIYEITQWNERVKRGEITWPTYLHRGKRPHIQRAPGTQAPVEPVAKPQGNETLLKEFNALDPRQQALLEEMFDKYAEAWEDFGENWWKKTDENKDLIIRDRTTNTALQSVYNTVNGTTAFSLSPTENQRMVDILQRLEENELGDNGYGFTRLIYRGDTPAHPVAQDFHFVEESIGMRWNGPQGQAAKKIVAQTNTIRLYGDSEGFNEISLFPDVTQAQLEKMIDALVLPGWKVRMGAHEVLSTFRKNQLHFHIEKVVDTSEENAADISITLNINFYRLAKGKNTAQTARQLTQLVGKYLNDDGRNALQQLR